MPDPLRSMHRDAKPHPENPVLFDLSGGHLALDYANTLSGRRGPAPEEHLKAYSDLLHWAEQAGIAPAAGPRGSLNPGEAGALATAELWGNAIRLREALYRIFSAVAARKNPAASDLEVLNRDLQKLGAKSELATVAGGFRWRWAGRPDSGEQILWRVARAAGDLLVSPERVRVRECEAATCAWLFLDHSKNQSRRWCDMQVCGNREKARRYYRRSRA